MSDAKPPDGCATWLDFCVSNPAIIPTLSMRSDLLDAKPWEYGQRELAALRQRCESAERWCGGQRFRSDFQNADQMRAALDEATNRCADMGMERDEATTELTNWARRASRFESERDHVAKLMRDAVERRDALFYIVRACHEAIGEDPGSDDASLPATIAKIVSEGKERIDALAAENERLRGAVVQAVHEIDSERSNGGGMYPELSNATANRLIAALEVPRG